MKQPTFFTAHPFFLQIRWSRVFQVELRIMCSRSRSCLDLSDETDTPNTKNVRLQLITHSSDSTRMGDWAVAVALSSDLHTDTYF